MIANQLKRQSDDLLRLRASLDTKTESENRLEKQVRESKRQYADLESRMNQQNDDRIQEIDDLRTKLMRENQFLRNLANKSNSVYFDAYRTKAYDGGGEENLTFQVGHLIGSSLLCPTQCQSDIMALR